MPKVRLAFIMLMVLLLIGVLQPHVSRVLSADPNGASPSTLGGQSTPTPITTGADKTTNMTTGVDPFKVHLEKYGPGTQQSTSNSMPVNSNATGTDPFKAFIELQNKQSKDAGVSPFGK